MKKRKLSKTGKVIIAAVVVCILISAFFILKPYLFSDTGSSNAVSSTSSSTVLTEEAQEYKDRKALNSEYVGRLIFDSGLVDQNVVQAEDNTKYLTKSWDLQDSTSGAAFMDYRNVTSNNNIIIYGHYVYKDTTKMFSPLEQLMDQNNYESNKYIEFRLADNDVRRYVITDVYYYEEGNTSLKYYYLGYSDSYFEEYYAAVKAADFYDTGETLTNDDHWITLQTCVRDHDELREIVLAKQISE